MRTPSEIVEESIAASMVKVERPLWKLLLLAIFAGAFIALAGVSSCVASAVGGKIAGAVFFCLGLVLVLLAGSELFTGNSLIFLAVLRKKVCISKMLLNWGTVYLGNFIGALMIALAAVYSGVLDNYAVQVMATAASKATLPFTEALLRGILCNILVCLAVWMAFAAKDVSGKVLVLILPISAFVLCGFEHSVANMYFFPAGVLMALRMREPLPAGILQMLLGNLLPVTLGNILGGAVFVAGGYHLALSEKKS